MRNHRLSECPFEREVCLRQPQPRDVGQLMPPMMRVITCQACLSAQGCILQQATAESSATL